ncbi:MAG: SAM hydrolase/SAM-dependent halogenase family protein [Flavobacteriaceae bacterium]
MPIITLTTDFGTKDHFVAAVKGAILTENPDAKIIDISHEIRPFNLTETGYILKNAYKSFPKGSIHIVGVDSELTPENKHIALKVDDHYFICPDNGVLSFITKDVNASEIVEINIHDRIETSFPVLDVFVKVATHIERGGKLGVIGKPLNNIVEISQAHPNINNETGSIVGHVIYIDNYGNVVTNISKEVFNEVGAGRSFEIQAGRFKINKIRQNYSDVVDFTIPKEKRQFDGSKIALFNTAGYLEIALYKSDLVSVGGASTLLGLSENSSVSINFNQQ